MLSPIFRLNNKRIGLLLLALLFCVIVYNNKNSNTVHDQLPTYLLPYRPFPIRIFNFLGSLLLKIGLLEIILPLDADRLISIACARIAKKNRNIKRGFSTSQCCSISVQCYNSSNVYNENGVNIPAGSIEDNHYYYNDFFQEGFHHIIQNLKYKSNLTLLGRIIAREQILLTLVMRGQLIEQFTNKKLENNSGATNDTKSVKDNRTNSFSTSSGDDNNSNDNNHNIIKEPIFIVGLPRTGTTFLYRLLSLDPMHRSPKHWEYMNLIPKPPIPPSLLMSSRVYNNPISNNMNNNTISQQQQEQMAIATANYNFITNQIINKQQNKLNLYKLFAPGLDSMYYLNASEADECIIVMSYMMDSQLFPVTYPGMETYMEWILNDIQDHTSTLKFHKSVLQHLQQENDYYYQEDDDEEEDSPPSASNTTTTAATATTSADNGIDSYCYHWLLKTPYYLNMLDDIRSIYPDAKIIQTHRDPIQSILSISSVIAKLYGIVSDDINLYKIIQHQIYVYATILDKALTVRQKWASDYNNSDSSSVYSSSTFGIIDIHLYDLQDNPMGVIYKIYKELFNRELLPSTEVLMRNWLSQNPRNKYGTHDVSFTSATNSYESFLKQYGFSETINNKNKDDDNNNNNKNLLFLEKYNGIFQRYKSLFDYDTTKSSNSNDNCDKNKHYTAAAAVTRTTTASEGALVSDSNRKNRIVTNSSSRNRSKSISDGEL